MMKQPNIRISASDDVRKSLRTRVPRAYTMDSGELHDPFHTLEMATEFPDLGRGVVRLISGLKLHMGYPTNNEETFRRLYARLTDSGIEGTDIHNMLQTSHVAVHSKGAPTGITYLLDNVWHVSSKIDESSDILPTQLLDEHCFVISSLASVLYEQAKRRKSALVLQRTYQIGTSQTHRTQKHNLSLMMILLRGLRVLITRYQRFVNSLTKQASLRKNLMQLR